MSRQRTFNFQISTTTDFLQNHENLQQKQIDAIYTSNVHKILANFWLVFVSADQTETVCEALFTFQRFLFDLR